MNTIYTLSEMEEFYDHLNQDQLEDEILKKYTNLINFNCIQFMFKKNNDKNMTKLLNHVKKDYEKICRFFLYRDEFFIYKDILISKLNLYDIDWSNINAKNIKIKTIQFILENLNLFNKFLSDSTKLFFHYKCHHQLLDIITPNTNVHLLLECCLSHSNTQFCDLIIQKSQVYSLNQLSCYLLPSNQPNVINWMKEQFKKMDNSLVEEEYEEIFYYILKSQNRDLIEWFFDNFSHLIEQDIYYFYNEIRFINNFELLKLLISKFPIEFKVMIEKEKNQMTFNNIDFYEYINKLYNIPFNEKIFWNLFGFQSVDNQEKFLRETFEKYPNLQLNDVDSLFKSFIFDKNILNIIKDKFPLFIENIINPLFQNFVIRKQYELCQWCLNNYQFLASHFNYDILDHKIFKMLDEHNIELPISYFDKIIKIAGFEGILHLIEYISQKFPNRYEIIFYKYQYFFFSNDFVKTFQIQIKLLKSIHDIHENHECFICLEKNHEIVHQTSCNHIYCKLCFDQYFQSRKDLNCAYCRQEIIHYDQLNQIKKIKNT